MYDVCIIGAGPAGSTLARLTGTHLRVLLVDARPLVGASEGPVPRKACGGLLAPPAQLELARQGLGLPAAVLAGPQVFAVRAVDTRSGLERLYQRHYVNIDRDLFERWLVSLVPAGVETLFGWKADRIETDRDGHTIRFRGPRGTHASARARLVVGADGATSIVRRTLMPQAASPSRYVCVQGTFEATQRASRFDAIFAPSLTDFYCWAVPKRDAVLVGGAFPAGPGANERYEAVVRLARAYGVPAGKELSRCSAALLRPLSPSQLCLTGDRAALVGEAAGMVSPSSGEGISYALRSAASLARALADGTEGAERRYACAVAPAVADILLRMGKSAVIHGPEVRALIMASGIGCVRIAPPGRALVESFGYR